MSQSDSIESAPWWKHFQPKLWTVFKEGYTWNLLSQDVVAGLVVGVVALPLAIAFAIASGVQPEKGLYTAIFAGLIISALGGCRVQIGGPTGAFVVIVYGVIQKYGYDGLATATLIAGFLLIGMALFRLGGLVKFVPYPLTVGFTSGIALIIATSQVREVLGLQMATVPAHFLPKILAFAQNIGTINPWTVGIAVLALGITLLWPRLTRRIPGSLVAILVTTALVKLTGMDQMGVDTVGSRFGAVPSGFPMPHLPKISFDLFVEMFNPAVSIALLAALESLLSAVVADGMTGRRHRSDTEILALGIANVVSPLFGGIPATGAIARTATNIKNGAKTPVAGIVHAFTLLLILLFLGKWAALIPLATLGAILLVVAYNMSEWRMFIKLFRSPTADVMVLLTSFFLTVLVDLTVAIEVGFVLSIALFMKRMADVSEVRVFQETLRQQDDTADGQAIRSRTVPAGVEVFEIYGSFFFGAADKFKGALQEGGRRPKVLILRLRDVLSLDATGLHALEEIQARCQREGTRLLLSGVHAQPMAAIVRSGFLEELGEDNVSDDIDDALEKARVWIATTPVTPTAALAS